MTDQRYAEGANAEHLWPDQREQELRDIAAAPDLWSQSARRAALPDALSLLDQERERATENGYHALALELQKAELLEALERLQNVHAYTDRSLPAWATSVIDNVIAKHKERV